MFSIIITLLIGQFHYDIVEKMCKTSSLVFDLSLRDLPPFFYLYVYVKFYIAENHFFPYSKQGQD